MLVYVFALILRAYIHAIKENLTGARLFEQVHAAQECAFAAAGGADDRYDLVLAEINAYVLYNIKLVIALAQVDDLYQLFICHGSSSFQPAR